MNLHGTMVTVFILCGIMFTSIKYWIPMLKRYYHLKRDTDAQVSNIIKYHSLVDSKYLFLYNYNLSDITVHSKDISMSYGKCLKTCSMKKSLKSLTLATDDVEIVQITIHRMNMMENLTFLALTIENAKYFNNDYLLPIIQNSKNLESILYQNGHLSPLSMRLLTELPKLNFLILDNICVTDSKVFSIMLFNLKVRQLAYHLKYGIYR